MQSSGPLARLREPSYDYRFRAKFLVILPIASGTGLVLVFKDDDKALSTPQVNAIGWLGLAATAGLAIHEYHAIRDCLVLMKRGQELEPV